MLENTPKYTTIHTPPALGYKATQDMQTLFQIIDYAKLYERAKATGIPLPLSAILMLRRVPFRNLGVIAGRVCCSRQQG